MKRILGILALVMAVSAPVLAQNQSTMTYHLQLNGTPSATWMSPYDTSTAVEVGPYVMSSFGDVLNWSVRLEVGGTIDGLLPGGAANIVFDLAIKDSTGRLVDGGYQDTDGGFGITTADTWAEAGFFSIVMTQTGGGPFAQQPAAFPWVFDTWYDPNGTETDTNPASGYGYGRLIDSVAANGPNMAQFTFPSTYKYYRRAGAANPITTGVSTPSGVLRGMGAGYTDFYFSPDAPERGGVGLTADNGQQCYGCTPGFWCMDIANRPIAEGQINMRGMPPGTYTLELTAGPGNNVLLPTIACSPYTGGTAGAFATAANTVTGSTITFVIPCRGDDGPLLQPGVASVKYHAGVAYGIPFIGEAASNPGGATALSVECRAGGVTQIVLPFSAPVEAIDGVIDGNEVVLTGGTLGTITQTTPGMLMVDVTGTANASCLKVTVSGLRQAGSGICGMPMATSVTKSIVVLRGDVTGNGAVDIGDVNAIKALSGAALNANAVAFRRDLTANGAIDIGDVNNAKSLSGSSFGGSCP